MYVSWVFADKLRMVMSSIMRWRSGEIGLVIGETPVSGLHKTCNPCRQATAYRCNHFDGVDRQAMTMTATSDNQILKSNIRNWTIGTFATGSLPRSGLVQREIMENGRLWNVGRGPPLVRLDVGRPDHLAPLLGFVSDELAEFGRRHRQRYAAEVGKPRLHLGIGEGGVDLLVEPVDNRDRGVLRRPDADPEARLIARHKVAHDW